MRGCHETFPSVSGEPDDLSMNGHRVGKTHSQLGFIVLRVVVPQRSSAPSARSEGDQLELYSPHLPQLAWRCKPNSPHRGNVAQQMFSAAFTANGGADCRR
jgi:hypothetical protein